MNRSSVFRDALALSGSPTNPITSASVVRLPDNRWITLVMLNLMKGLLQPEDPSVRMVRAGRLMELFQLADKFDVTAIIHNVYTVLIYKGKGAGAGRNKTCPLDWFGYAVAAKDPLLSKYIAAKYPLGDPLTWPQHFVFGIIGVELYWKILTNFPRLKATDAKTIIRNIDAIDWSGLVTKIQIRGGRK